MTENRRPGPPLNGLEWEVYHHIPRRKGIRVKTLVWLTAKHPDVVRRTLQQLEQLGVVTRASGVWKRT